MGKDCRLCHLVRAQLADRGIPFRPAASFQSDMKQFPGAHQRGYLEELPGQRLVRDQAIVGERVLAAERVGCEEPVIAARGSQ